MRNVVRTLSAAKPSALPAKVSVAMPSSSVGWKRYSLRMARLRGHRNFIGVPALEQ